MAIDFLSLFILNNKVIPDMITIITVIVLAKLQIYHQQRKMLPVIFQSKKLHSIQITYLKIRLNR